MTTIGERIKAAREALGFSQDELARRVGIKQQSVAELESGKTRTTKHLLKFARALGQSPEWLDSGNGSMAQTPPETLPQPNAGARLPAPSVAAMPIDVPVMGTAVGGSHGDFSLNGQVVDYHRRPPGILSNRSVFCLHVRGESMYPKYEEGDLVYVDPHRPTRSGDDVLVEMKPLRAGEPGPAYVKRLVSKTPTKIVLKQFNPPNDKIELQLEKILRVSLILRMTDLLGV